MQQKTIKAAAIIILAASISCVPQRKFQDLQKTHADALQKNIDCNKALADEKTLNEENATKIKVLEQNVGNLQQDTTLMGANNRKLNLLYGQINDSYEKLLRNQKELENQNKLKTDEMSAEMKELQRKLNEKEIELDQKQVNLQKQNAELNLLKSDLDKTQKDLQEREKRVAELSSVLNEKDSVVNALRNTVANALLSFKDKGMSVNIKNGKVYVSVDEKLLFESGKYTVNASGKAALLELANALNASADVNIMVEGHTDNKPYNGTGVIKDNLDLSVLRATEVSRILTKDGKVDATRVTASGRGETQPIATNDTPEGRAKNRRTEIILTPQLGELFKILEN